MRLYLIRHAQTAWNSEGRAQGWTDIELDEIGREQSRRLSNRLKNEPISRLITSDLKRCLQTSDAIISGRDVQRQATAQLRERSIGDWDGSLFSEIRPKMAAGITDQDPYAHHFRPPNGESLVDVWERMMPISQELASQGENCAIVSHGGSLSILMAQLLGAAISTSRSFRFGNASVTVLGRNDWGLFCIESYNDTSHLNSIASIAGNLDGTVR